LFRSRRVLYREQVVAVGVAGGGSVGMVVVHRLGAVIEGLV